MVSIQIDGKQFTAEEGRTIMAVAYEHGVYIPAICHHPDLPPFKHTRLADRVYRGDTVYENEAIESGDLAVLEGCGLCVVEVAGAAEPVRACRTRVTEGMSVTTDGDRLRELRRERLVPIMARHPHACITCAQREGCSLEDCSSNTARQDRCCWKFDTCELRKVAEYVGIPESTPRYQHPGMPVLDSEPLYTRNFNLCIDCGRCVRVCNHVRGVEALGIVHRGGRLVVGSVEPTLESSDCRFCGACVEVCPTGCLMDKNGRRGEREQRLVPCTGACAAGADVPGYIRAVARGDYGNAAALIREYLPLPNTLGHICFHECETGCRRGALDDAIAICALKRFAVRQGDAGVLERIAIPDDGAGKIAVVGGGPAGLSAAYFLRFKGYEVTVFEAAARAGGVPATAIPEHRLPGGVMARDVEFIEKMGVAIETGRRFDGGDQMTALLDDGFDAVVVSVGLPASKKISLPGSDLAGVRWGLEFLQRVKSGEFIDLGSKVVVVGGGNVAVDVAMTALRLTAGTGSIRLFCLEGRDEMPAHRYEIEKAVAEGIDISAGWGPSAIAGDAGRVESIEFRKCTSVFDSHGNFHPEFDESTKTSAEATAVILAIGQDALGGLPAGGGAVFLAGDAAGAGKFSVVDAVASGRAAAEAADRFLGGDGDVSIRLAAADRPSAHIGRVEGFASMGRAGVPVEDPLERRADFREIEGVLAEEDARYEAGRCLQCDLRLDIAAVHLPPERWLRFEASNVAGAPAAEGVYVLCGDDKVPTAIKGTGDIRAALEERLAGGADAVYFYWEEDGMYTKRESELIQQHLNRYGEMPGGGDDELDDLF